MTACLDKESSELLKKECLGTLKQISVEKCSNFILKMNNDSHLPLSINVTIENSLKEYILDVANGISHGYNYCFFL